jgi:hypothetical protein
VTGGNSGIDPPSRVRSALPVPPILVRRSARELADAAAALSSLRRSVKSVYSRIGQDEEPEFRAVLNPAR